MAAAEAIATASTSNNNIKARILAVMHDDSVSREQKLCLAQAIYLERMQALRKRKIQADDDGAIKRTFRSAGNYGCSHYKRNCRIKAECCQRFFTCRLCHDEECSHKIDRYATKRMVCMFCLTEQDIAAECANKDCGKKMAKYFCAKCRLFDDDYVGIIFHCDDCGLCRKAESDEYWHCKTCNTCLTTRKEDHHCLEHVLDQNCPVCNEYLFTSLTPITFPDCMHPMHEACMNSFSRTSTRCPICCRSLYVDEHQNLQIEQYLLQNQMPEEYAGHMAEILCNDCLVKSTTKFHFVYHKCFLCEGFNTRVLRSGPGPLDPTHPTPAAISQSSSSSQRASSESSQPNRPHPQSPVPTLPQGDVDMDTESPVSSNFSSASGAAISSSTSSSPDAADTDDQMQADSSHFSGDTHQDAMQDDLSGSLIHSLHSFPIVHAMRANNTSRSDGVSSPQSQPSSLLSNTHMMQSPRPTSSTGTSDQRNVVNSDQRNQSSSNTSTSSSSSSSSSHSSPSSRHANLLSHTSPMATTTPSSTSSSGGHFPNRLSHSQMSDVSHSTSSLMFSAGHVAAQAHVAMAHRLRASRSPARETGAPMM